ncbi:MAG TPA: CiaB protein [Arcobacter sp.]|nr:CiaB protein [Arcobacter sp.]
MKNENFTNDIQKLYDYITNKKEDINKLYMYLETSQFDKLEIIEDFAKHLNLELSDDLRVALVGRLVSLRDDSLVQVLRKLNLSEDEVIVKIELAYTFVRDYWTAYHQDTVEYIEKKQLLSPFYEAVFKGVYNVGLQMSIWQSSWTKEIINTVNKDLISTHKTDEKVMDYLEKNKLFDIGHDDDIADRSYSILVKENNKYKNKAYKEAFSSEVNNVIDALEDFSDNLIDLEDDIFNQKWEYVQYIQALVTAFSEKRTNKLVHYWAEVDRAWMKITTPIQIGHPLEYYEDHYRKAVALEWDIRLTNPQYQKENIRASKLENMFKDIYSSVDTTNTKKDIYDFSLKSLKKVQLYLGRPALFFGAEFNGLFSAQVVPNDEKVSKEFGKKIFAFSDEILQSQRAKPFLKLSREILGQEFLAQDRNFLFKSTQDWHKVYDITTIGHEFGHILWCDEETEMLMNKSANFKNIEEFKATTGGLVSFFTDNSSDEKYLEEHVVSDTIKRAIGLIGWMEVDEVQPYYCEGLIHLNGLFKCEVIVWSNETNKLTINTNEENIEKLKMWYTNTYSSLASHYLEKQDALIWLNKFAIKEDKYFLPTNKNIKDFVLYYFDRYKKIGQELDTTDSKDNY